MNIARWGMTALATVLFAGGAAFAEDSSSLRAELADLKAKVSAMESAKQGGCSTCGGNGCSTCGGEGLTSMGGNATIQIGGSVHADLIFIHGDSNETTVASGDDDDDYRRTVFNAGSDAVSDPSFLDLKVSASDNMYFMITLELNNDENGSADILENLYFAWEGVRGSAWDLYIGEKTVDYGMDKYTGIIPTFNDGGAYLLNEGFGGPSGATAGNTSGGYGIGVSALAGTSNGFATSRIEVYQIEAVYHYCDLANFYFTVFQNGVGVFEDHSTDDMGFESWAIKAEVMPMEGLTLQASVQNWRNDALRKTANRDEDSMSLSVGFDYDFQCLPLNLWAEYQHDFDAFFSNQTDIDIFSIGATYGFSECLAGTVMFDWAEVDDPLFSGPTSLTTVQDEDYYQIAVNLKYTFDNGVYFLGEYAYSWFDAERTAGGDIDGDVSLLGFRVGLDF